MDLNDNDFEWVHECPWDAASEDRFEFLYKDQWGCDIVRCCNCGLVFAKKRLSKSGLDKYWKHYLSRVHLIDARLVSDRNRMYQIDYNYINGYVKRGRVLDVGCGNGAFMALFEKNGYETMGVEFGKEAYEKADLQHNVRYGTLPDIDFSETFDLIIFRGVLQYIQTPIPYIKKAISLLNDRGYIFITAQPNMDSFCAKLYGNRFVLPVTAADCVGYNQRLLTAFFEKNDLRKVGETYFYEETPYADVENDILRVARAIKQKKEIGKILESSPPFWGNMMSLIYQKKKIV